MKVTILGCGASGGVPRIGGKDRAGNWEKCDPTEPKNRRMRASILVEQGETRILVDTSPDLRQQCLTFGIDRWANSSAPLPVWCSEYCTGEVSWTSGAIRPANARFRSNWGDFERSNPSR